MTADTLATFEASLDRLDVGVTLTTREGLAAALDRVVDRPAVGVAPPFDATLPDWIDTDPTPATLRDATTGVTGATLGIADYGSVVLEATPDGTEPTSLFVDRHVAVLRRKDVVDGMPAAFERLGPRLRDGRSAVIATGPSATADMGALVRGAHGPKTVHVVVLGE